MSGDDSGESPGSGLVSRYDVGLDLALQVLAGARAEAERRGVALAIVVVDGAGGVVVTGRMDGAQLVAVQLATDKAFTAVALGQPTETWSDSTAPGGSNWGMTTTCGGRLIVLAGGLPLRRGGELVGAVGVSGAAADVDRGCAAAGLLGAGFDD